MRVLLGCLVAAGALAADAAPAFAHDLGGRRPTNVRSRIVRMDPPVPGVEVRVVELGARVELTNRSDETVVVLGYEGEPYLRVGPEGVFENTRAPALFHNRTATPPASVPDRYDATAPPSWHRISRGETVRWHDHRAHYMGTGRPTDQPGTSQRFSEWTIDLRVDGRPVVVHGELAWVPAPPWWPWALLALGVAAAVVLAARRHWRATVGTTLAVLIVGGGVHVAGGWTEAANGLGARAGAAAIPVLGAVLAIFALVRVLRRDADAAAPWAFLAALVLTVGLGFGDVLDLVRSQLPSSLPAPVVRALVAVAIGGGIGTAIAAATRLRPGEPAAHPADPVASPVVGS